jgi:hypothetical protein
MTGTDNLVGGSREMGKSRPGHEVRYYFVDESGDPVLFSGSGSILLGTPGCSRFFILGLLDVRDPAALSRDMEALRHRLIDDPYFANVPSMRSDSGKTALAFHAKDDLPEVRREVFALLMRHEMRFHAVVRDKKAVLAWAREKLAIEPSFRYRPSSLYETMVSRLFKTRLHVTDEYQVFFARRQKGDRVVALRNALDLARRRFRRTYNRFAPHGLLVLTVLSPFQRAELQAVDYFLWALQRAYEKGEDRFVKLLWPAFGAVHDVDDTREARYGVYYNKKRPLSAAVSKASHGV